MDYDAILFDLDGVLVEGRATDPAVYEQAARDTAAAFGLDERRNLVDLLADPTSLSAVREALEPLDVDAEAVWRYREERACEIENERIRAAGRQRYPDVDVLEELAADTRMGVVSNNRMGTVEFVCEHFEFDGVLETWYGRHPTFDGHDRMKPDPYYLERALEDLDATDEMAAEEIATEESAGGGRALFVGDRESDVITAHRAGVDAALLRREHNHDVTAEPTPDHVLDGLYDLVSG
jgi:phosphoglycolate phosphatase-like HAD superfamily hydrolase